MEVIPLEIGPAYETPERRKLSCLKPYERNARLHDPAQIEALKQSFREFGWTIPVLIDEDDGIIAGHARVQVAQALGIDDGPVLVARGWSEGKKRAYILADNKLTERGGWNWELVAAELRDIRDLGVELELTGFEAHELGPLLGAEWKTEEPEPEDTPHGSTDAHTITVTREQYETFQRRVALEREAAREPKMSEGKALERICERL